MLVWVLLVGWSNNAWCHWWGAACVVDNSDLLLDEGWLLDGRCVCVFQCVVGFWLVRTDISDFWTHFVCCSWKSALNVDRVSFVDVVVLGIESLNIWMGEVDWRFQIFCFCFLLFLFCLVKYSSAILMMDCSGLCWISVHSLARSLGRLRLVMEFGRLGIR